VQQFPVVNCLGDARRQVNFLQSLHFWYETSPFLSTADAFSLLSKQLDNALQQQKREIFNVLEAKIPAPSVDTSKKEFKFKYISNKN
jgi:hypothetical protein